MILLQIISNYFTRKKQKLIESFYAIDVQYDALALFGLVNFTVLYTFDDQYPTELIGVHWIGLILCTLLLLIDFLPKQFQLYKKIYWYGCLCYILCFFSVSQLLFTYASAQSLLNIILCLFLLVVSTDWLVACCLLALGAIFSFGYASLLPGVSMSWDYYLRGYAENSQGIGYSEVISPSTSS
ncbi:MAG: hypothetical protein K5Q00_03860, partial [Gammaproteobacteria bacterium]|nr:hypothetical protein [Gammaproteobacteria bacterium]